MLLTSNSFLFLFLPFSLLINFFNIDKKIKTIFLGLVSGYFYFVDNGYLIVILLFLSILMKYQIENKKVLIILSLSHYFYLSFLFLSTLLFCSTYFKLKHLQ